MKLSKIVNDEVNVLRMSLDPVSNPDTDYRIAQLINRICDQQRAAAAPYLKMLEDLYSDDPDVIKVKRQLIPFLEGI